MELSNILSVITQHSKFIIDAGKIVLTLIFLFLSFISLILILSFAGLLYKLHAMEMWAHDMRDEVVVMFVELRARLYSWRQPRTIPVDRQELFKSAGRLLMLFLHNERDVFRWGKLGWKLMNNAWSFFRRNMK